MAKITFIGAGSTIFAKNILGDCFLTTALKNSEIVLYDIDPKKLKESQNLLENINKNNGEPMRVISNPDRKKAFDGADYVINAIQVGGYRPSTVIDFEIPKKHGLRQTIGDTLGIGGIFRALRTIPVLLEIARDMEEVCPDAWFLNYSNPMAILTGTMLKATAIKTVGLCHSVQKCVPDLMRMLGMETHNIQWKIAGINHQAWLLEINDNGKNLYPEIKRRAFSLPGPHNDMVRIEIMKQFGYYPTESSEHNAEYLPYFIKKNYPELIERFNIPLDEYPRRCEKQIEEWKMMRNELANNKNIIHNRSHEYGASILEAMETDVPFRYPWKCG